MNKRVVNVKKLKDFIVKTIIRFRYSLYTLFKGVDGFCDIATKDVKSIENVFNTKGIAIQTLFSTLFYRACRNYYGLSDEESITASIIASISIDRFFRFVKLHKNLDEIANLLEIDFEKQVKEFKERIQKLHEMFEKKKKNFETPLII